MSELREERIRHRAYLLWEAQGAPVGSDWDYWLQAEAEILAEEEGTASQPQASPDADLASAASNSPLPAAKANGGKAAPRKAAAAKAAPSKATTTKSTASKASAAKPARARKTKSPPPAPTAIKD